MPKSAHLCPSWASRFTPISLFPSSTKWGWNRLEVESVLAGLTKTCDKVPNAWLSINITSFFFLISLTRANVYFWALYLTASKVEQHKEY